MTRSTLFFSLSLLLASTASQADWDSAFTQVDYDKNEQPYSVTFVDAQSETTGRTLLMEVTFEGEANYYRDNERVQISLCEKDQCRAIGGPIAPGKIPYTSAGAAGESALMGGIIGTQAPLVVGALCALIKPCKPLIRPVFEKAGANKMGMDAFGLGMANLGVGAAVVGAGAGYLITDKTSYPAKHALYELENAAELRKYDGFQGTIEIESVTNAAKAISDYQASHRE